MISCSTPESLVNQRLIVKIKAWPRNSPFPIGQFVKVLGEEGKPSTERAMILHEFNVDTRPFSTNVLKCLPKEGANFQVPEEERPKRWDLRHLPVCSVDPPGCKDIDDALHCRTLPNGNLEVGVHIADVTHFVKAGSELDREAARRCTTVYLVGQRTDMLPKLLTETLCSLVCKVEKLAFSVLWEFDPKTMAILNIKYGKSIIYSQASLTYYQAQDMIDDAKDNSDMK